MTTISLEESIQEHEKLVHYVARRFRKRANFLGIEYDDLISEAKIGLIKAIQKFDESFGVKFATYAVPSIEGQIRRFFRDTNPGPKFSRRAKELSVNLTGDETVKEIVEKFQVSPSRAEEALAYKTNSWTFSMDKKVNGDEDKDLTLSDLIEHREDFSSVEVDDFLSYLGSNLRTIIELAMEDKTQQEIADKVGCSQVHVSRQIKKIQKLYLDYSKRENKEEKVMGKLVMTAEEFVDLRYKQKLTFLKIAQLKGVADPTIHNWKDRHADEIKKALKALNLPAVEEKKTSAAIAPQKPKQPATAVIKAPEPKPIGEAINEALNEAFAEKSAEYERLIAALRNDLNTAHQQLDQKDEQIRNLEHLHDACEDCENEISSLQQEKEEWVQKYNLLQEMALQANSKYQELLKENLKPLEEENQILRQLVKKWA